jgi:hypothetical protein
MHIDTNNKRTIVINLGIAIKSYNDSQMRSFVYQARTQNVGDWVQAIQQFPLRCCSQTDPILFLQFNLNVAVGGKLKPIIGWAHPDLMFHFRAGPCPIFLDCTFRTTPEKKIFKQTMIIMMYVGG